MSRDTWWLLFLWSKFKHTNANIMIIDTLDSFRDTNFRAITEPFVSMNKNLNYNGHATQITRFIGPTGKPPGSCRPQMGPLLAPWTLLSGERWPKLLVPYDMYETTITDCLVHYVLILCQIIWTQTTTLVHNKYIISGIEHAFVKNLFTYPSVRINWLHMLYSTGVYDKLLIIVGSRSDLLMECSIIDVLING